MFYWQAGGELLCVPGRVSTALYLVVFPRVTTVVCFIWQAGGELLCVPGRVSTALYLVVFPRVTTVVCFIWQAGGELLCVSRRVSTSLYPLRPLPRLLPQGGARPRLCCYIRKSTPSMFHVAH